MKTKFYLLSYLLFCSAIIANAQTWSSLTTGTNGIVYAMAGDTATGTLYVGGNFTNAGGVPVNYIAAWDGATWSTVGTGLNNSVNTLYFSNGILYAGGNFTTAGSVPANFIAKWDGVNWSAMGAGMDNGVLTIAEDGSGNIYAGGGFSLAGGVAANHIAVWDGTNWDSLGTGLGIAGDYVETIGVFNGDVYAGGRYVLAGAATVNSIAKWDGTNWNPLSTGVTGASGRVTGIKTYNSELYVCGSFTNAGGIPANSIAKWNGTAWSVLAGGGLTGGQAKPTSIEVLYNELYVGGSFTTAGAVATNNIAKYVGSNWFAIDGGVNAQVDFLFPFADKIFVGGQFLTADTLTVNFIASYKPACNSLVNSSITSTTCFAFCDGTISLNPVGSSPFSYQWSNGAITDSVAGLCAGTYTVTVANIFGCTVEENYTVNEPPQITLSFTATDAICAAQCSGTATALPVNTQGSVSYFWNSVPVQNNQTADSLCAGTYTVQLVDSAGCNALDSVIINEPVANIASVGFSIPSCFGGCNGYAIASSTGISPFTFSWTTLPIQTTDTAFNLCAGTYSVTVTDSLGCEATEVILLTDPAPNQITTSVVSTTCFGGCDGTATASSTGLPPFTFSWQTLPVQDSATAIGLCAGVTLVIITDSLGCAVTDSVSISEPFPNVISSISTPTSCAAVCNGMVSLSSTGVSPFQYVWSTGDSLASVFNLCEGGYAVTVTDSLGCAVSDSAFVTIAAPIPLIFTTQAAGCSGQCTGNTSVQLQTSLAATFIWNNGDTTSALDSLCTGMYSVSIVDTIGCTYSDSVAITAGVPFALNAIVAPPQCFGDCNASVVLNPAGAAPYIFIWATGDTTNVINNVCAGSYAVQVIDSSNCNTLDTILVTDPPAIAYTKLHTDAICPGACNGTATLSNATGNGSLTYLWNTVPLQTDSIATGLCYGFTTFTVTDSVGCTRTDSILVFEPPAILIFNNQVNITCNGLCNGSATTNVFGGTPPYTYLWSSGAPINLCAGTYTVTVTDANACTAIDSVVISEPLPITITPTVINASCIGCTDGSISVSISGGTAPYNYLFTSLAISDTVANNLAAGLYEFCVLDTNNCFTCDSILVTEPNSIFNSYQSSSHVIIYPNPAKGIFYIKSEKFNGGAITLTVSDISGRIISVKTTTVNEKTIAVDGSYLKKGMYIVSIITNHTLFSTGRIVIN